MADILQGCQLLGGWTPVPAELSQCTGINCFSSVGTGGGAQGEGGLQGGQRRLRRWGPVGRNLATVNTTHCGPCSQAAKPCSSGRFSCWVSVTRYPGEASLATGAPKAEHRVSWKSLAM